MAFATVIMLGSGTSNGVPTLGIEYPPEFLANPKNHRTRPSILVQGPTGNLLVDCTPEMRLQIVREGILDVESVLLTHSHADHLMGMDDLRSFGLKYARPITIYTYPQFQDDIRRIFSYAFEDFPPGIDVPRFDLQDVPPVIAVGGMQVQTMQVWHGKMPCTAIRIHDFAYVTDVSEIPEEAWMKLQGLDTLILDAVRYKPHPNHFHYEKAIEVAQALGAKRTIFTHLSHDYDHDKVNAELPAGIELGYDRMRIEIA